MAKMRDRNTSPPLGWLWLESQTGWNAPPNASFDVVVNALIEHRKANKWITEQHHLPTDYDAVADQIDTYNAERMLKAGWSHFLSEATPSGSWLPQRLSRSAASVVASLKKTAAGIKVVAQWWGEGLRPVEQPIAEKRGSRCVECPQNKDPNWIQKLDAAAADEIRKMSGIKNDLKLETKYDNQLLSCQVCDCPMTLKIWTPIKHISSETSTDTLNKLSAVKTASGKGCWVPEEIAAMK